jgi:propanol-preferring alcohol dehydrogenase
MRAVEVSPGYAALHDVAAPELRPGFARVAVRACGVCATDVHVLRGMVLPKGVDYPLHPGHEVAGVVIELDHSMTDGDVNVGDLVVLHPLATCGRCLACRSGDDERCTSLVALGFHSPGGMADEVLWPTNRMVPVPGLPAPQAALLADAVATALHALGYADVPPGGTLVVLGAGGVGSHVIKLAIAQDPTVRVAALVRSEVSADRVSRLGAHALIDLQGAGDRVRRMFGPVDAVIDFSGNRHAPAEGLRMLRRGGRLVLGSVVDEPVTLGTTITGLTSREVDIRGAYVSSMTELRAAAKMALDGTIDLTDSVSAVYPLEDAVKALHLVSERPPGIVRVVLEP